MILKAPIIEIDQEYPFKFDALKRFENAEVLTEFIQSTEDPLVLAINSPWGTGKTTFIKMWERHLQLNSFTTLYFNAWENDFAENAFVAFISEIEEAINHKFKGNRKIKSNLNKFKKAGVHLLKATLPAVVKLGTSGVLDINKATEEVIAQYAEKIAAEQITAYQSSKDAVKEFKKLLVGFVDQISTSGDEPKPLIFFIDELDRCRPLFAIELIEKIKHLFYTNNIIFVLSIDKEQLCHSIKSIYGVGMNVDGYLRRFIDIEYQIPKPQKGEFVSYLFDKYGFQTYFSKKRGYRGLEYEGDNFKKISSDLFLLYDFSLREQEQLFTQVSIVLKTIPESYASFPLLLVYLLCIRAKDISHYNKIISKQLDGSVAVEELKHNFGKTELFKDEYGYGPALEASLIYALRDERSGIDITKPYQKILNDPKADDISKSRAERIISIINSYTFDRYEMIDYLSKKIEISERFNKQN